MTTGGAGAVVDIRRHPDFADSLAPAPWANPELIGHDGVERYLAGAVSDGTVGGAWLLGGMAGIGKATLAYRLAAFLLSNGGGGLFGETGAGLRVAPGDPVATRVSARAHGDLLTVEPGRDSRGRPRSDVVVDDVRRLAPFFHQSAANDGWRIAIVDEADSMNVSAANAALKLVEEPPRRSLVILVAHVPGRLPATLRSRCRRLHLRPLPTGQVVALLERYLPGMAEEDRIPLARLSEGSPGRAMAFAQFGGLELYRRITGLIAEAPNMDPAALHALADRLGGPDADRTCRAALEFLAAWLARLVCGVAGGAGLAEPVVVGEADVMARLAGRCELDRWCALWEKIVGLRDMVGSRNLDRKQAVLAAFGALQNTVRA